MIESSKHSSQTYFRHLGPAFSVGRKPYKVKVRITQGQEHLRDFASMSAEVVEKTSRNLGMICL
jgi:hypothetical protein